jgi:diaminohydroxyphosphoribosylaminopyrimidine deaminase / 5-amino-6-(5-phosphoribosylamino)uracil reductase
MLTHAYYMHRAFQLAQRGAGHVSPNPMVGAVIVHEGRIIGEGYHARYGGPHAEVQAVASVADPSLLPYATLYCTLEPCFHHGKTPPCVELVLRHRFRQVVVAATDPNPLVAGQSLAKMRAEGIEVVTGVLEERFYQQNAAFVHWMRHGQQLPYIILKWAQSSDGFLARAGERTAVSGALARRLVHRWRTECDAILVGTETAIIDNPRLDARFFSGKNPLRVAIDRMGRIPNTHHLLDDTQPTWIVGTEREGQFTQTQFLPSPTGETLETLCSALAQNKKAILLVEGGARLLSSFIEKGLYHEVRTITAPVKLGSGVAAPVLPVGFEISEAFSCGEDVVQYRRTPFGDGFGQMNQPFKP